MAENEFIENWFFQASIRRTFYLGRENYLGRNFSFSGPGHCTFHYWEDFNPVQLHIFTSIYISMQKNMLTEAIASEIWVIYESCNLIG